MAPVDPDRHRLRASDLHTDDCYRHARIRKQPSRAGSDAEGLASIASRGLEIQQKEGLTEAPHAQPHP